MIREKAFSYVLARLQETSTVRGIVGVVTLVGGSALAPDRLDHVAITAVFVTGLMKVILPDRWTKAPPADADRTT